jgi:surfeit locus 1 family protein
MGPRKYDTHNGYHILTPLERSSSSNHASTILVNRGFISDSTAASFDKDAQRISKHADAGDIAAVNGILAPPFTPSTFTPANDPEKGVWIWVDLPAIAQHVGGDAEGVQPILIESIFGERFQFSHRS